MNRADRADHHLIDERFGALPREFGIEMLDEQEIDAEKRDLALLDAKRRQAKRLAAGNEDVARVRLEGQYRARRAAASPISAAWPLCSPSKLPIASTAPRAYAAPEPGCRMMRRLGMICPKNSR
jgi:hypothetical protein